MVPTRTTERRVAPVLLAAMLGATFASPAPAAPEEKLASREADGARGAKTPKKPPSNADRRKDAREAFTKGTLLVEDARWADALTQFEKAQRLVPHPVTLYNVGICLRAMGRYTAAREVWRRALAQHAKDEDGKRLPRRLVEDTHGYLRGLDKVIARVTVTVKPASAALSVDGRPLAWAPKALPKRATGIPSPDPDRAAAKSKAAGSRAGRVAIAGIRAPGPGEPPQADTFVLEMDPGNHVLTFSRKGFTDQIVRKDFTSGPNPPLDLRLDKLPATIRVDASVDGALVFLGERDLGPAPVTVRRPAGAYELRIERDGFETYRSQLEVKPGEDAALRADLVKDEPLIIEQWWFWTAAAVVVSGAAVGTYFLVRDDPEPQRQPVDGGSLGLEIPIP